MVKNQIAVFSSSAFGEIRTTKSDSGEPLFCLVDVCKALDLSNPSQVKSRLNIDGVISNEGVCKTKNQHGCVSEQKVQMNFINEPNLYRCIFMSRKKEAEKFQEWIYGEVLPALRQTGGYMMSSPEETPEQLMARALKVAEDTLQRAMDCGLFEIKKTVIQKPDGDIIVSTTPKVTGKGQVYFLNKLREASVAASSQKGGAL